jgi:DNA-binding transcriptional ArsR family regulator
LSSERALSVSVAYGDVKVEFSGPPEVVFRSLHEFIAKEIPNIDLAKSISVNYSLNDLVQMFKDYIRFTEEGPRVWVQDRKLSDKDVILLQLAAARAARLSGKGSIEDMSVSELETATSLNPKTIGSRLSELNKVGAVERRDAEGTGRYKVTTTGVHWLHTQLQKKFPKSAQASPV